MNKEPVLADQIESPRVNADRSVTFQFDGRGAESVEVRIERVKDGRYKLVREGKGPWQVTTSPLPPGIYEYRFIVDGVSQLDPRNRWVKKWYTLNSLVEVPGETPLVTERQSVAHGTLHHHLYHSDVTEGDRAAIVYTPPSYEEHPDKAYPVMFLLHGFGDDQTAWTEVGRANLIADNLIAQKSIAEMIIVMPHGHPAPLPYGPRPGDYGIRNNTAIEQDIVQVLLPLVEKRYRAKGSADDRAIVGLSMGGGHSLLTGLKNTDKFGYVGAFSAACPQDSERAEVLNSLKESDCRPKLVWIACGEDDFLVKRNRSFTAALYEKGIENEYLETKGAHNWDVWRDYLPQFMRLLFR